MVPTATTPIYRLMHIDNLHVCLERKGMHAPNYIPNDRLVYKTIHNPEIQHQRHISQIPCGQGGVIHDYLPFYFGVLSPMLYQLHTGWVTGYDEGQTPLIYIVSSAQSVDNAGIPFVFSDGHGIATFTSWFDDLKYLNQVDWGIVNERWWRDTTDDPDKQRRKQAEFLVHVAMPWKLVSEIGVYDDQMKNRVQGIIGQYKVNTPVIVRRQWYY